MIEIEKNGRLIGTVAIATMFSLSSQVSFAQIPFPWSSSPQGSPPVQAQSGGKHARAGAPVRAERDVVEQAHVRPQLHVLEGARHAALRDHALRHSADVVAEKRDRVARLLVRPPAEPAPGRRRPGLAW